MTGTQDDVRAPTHVPPIDADARELDEIDEIDDTLPTTLDVPIEKPIEDVIESLQGVGDADDDYEPHA